VIDNENARESTFTSKPGRQLQTLPLVERTGRVDPVYQSLADRRIALVRQDVAHGDEPGEPLRAEG
jgi:DNA repair protein RecO (recombination protein O)